MSTWIEKTKKLYSRVKSIGGFGSLLGFIHLLAPHIAPIWRSTQDWYFALDIWARAGGSMAVILSVITHPLFGFVLLASGVGYMLKFPDAQAAIHDHPVINGFARALFGAAAVGLFAAVLLNNFVSDTDYSGVLNEARDSRIERRLLPDDYKRIVQVFAPTKDAFGPLSVGAFDGEPSQYAFEFMIAFQYAGVRLINGSGMDIFPFQLRGNSTEMKGLMIGVLDPEAPPDIAVRFQKTLKIAGFDAAFAKNVSRTKDQFSFDVLPK